MKKILTVPLRESIMTMYLYRRRNSPVNDINLRVKELRTSLDLSQAKFGGKLGVSPSGIAKIETGDRPVTDQMKLSIVNTFSISQTWLETGEGDMFSTSDDLGAELGRLFAEKNDFAKSLLLAFAKLGPEEWAVLEKLIKNLKEN